MTRNAMFEVIRDRAMKVSRFRLHSEVFLFMIDCNVKWLVIQDTIKKIIEEELGQEKNLHNMAENSLYLW